ncbi:MAG: ATP-grasp domain-containing protein [Planctomycetes bacterium]|nr:ATP-grasp domain-containing protein [Planctomycetota bacterium]
MKTLVCLYPGSASDRAVFFGRFGPGLREQGVRLVLADDWQSPRDRELFDEFIELPPAEEVRGATKVLDAFAARTRIDGVLAQSEAALAPGAWLTAQLGLPGASPSGALACLAKNVSRARLAAARVPVPEFRLVSDASGVRAFAREHGYPVVLKACASTLGRLVTKVASDAEVDDAVTAVRAGLLTSRDVKRLVEFAELAGLDAGCDPRASFLVERFFDGEPLETDGLVLDGRPCVFGVVEQTLTPPPRFYVESYRLPADRPPELVAACEDISRRALAASGVRSSGFSIELRARGADVRVIEVNARLGEDDAFAELFEAALGFVPLAKTIELALGNLDALDARVREHWCLAYRSHFEAGRVVRVPSATELAALAARGIRAAATARVGEPWYAAPHPDAFPHVAWALASDPRSSSAAYRSARATADALDVAVEP